MMTKQDALAQMQEKKNERIFHHLEVLKMYGPTKGLTQKEWNKVEIKVKGSGSKGKGYASNRLWSYDNSGVRIYKQNTSKS
jgi:hypothetical protein